MSKEGTARLPWKPQPESQHPPSKKPVKFSSAGQLGTLRGWEAPQSESLHPVDAIYSKAMMAGYEAIAPLDSTTNVFNPTDIAYVGRHTVFDEQDVNHDPMLPLYIDELDMWLTPYGNPIPRHATWNNRRPIFTDTDCTPASVSRVHENSPLLVNDKIDEITQHRYLGGQVIGASAECRVPKRLLLPWLSCPSERHLREDCDDWFDILWLRGCPTESSWWSAPMRCSQARISREFCSTCGSHYYRRTCRRHDSGSDRGKKSLCCSMIIATERAPDSEPPVVRSAITHITHTHGFAGLAWWLEHQAVKKRRKSSAVPGNGTKMVGIENDHQACGDVTSDLEYADSKSWRIECLTRWRQGYGQGRSRTWRYCHFVKSDKVYKSTTHSVRSLERISWGSGAKLPVVVAHRMKVAERPRSIKKTPENSGDVAFAPEIREEIYRNDYEYMGGFELNTIESNLDGSCERAETEAWPLGDGDQIEASDPKSEPILPYENFTGAFLTPTYRLLRFLRTESHGKVYSVEHLSDPRAKLEAKLYPMQGLSRELFKYRKRNLKRLEQKDCYVETIRHHDTQLVIYTASPPVLAATEKLGACGRRNTVEFERVFPPLPKIDARGHRELGRRDMEASRTYRVCEDQQSSCNTPQQTFTEQRKAEARLGIVVRQKTPEKMEQRRLRQIRYRQKQKQKQQRKAQRDLDSDL